MASAFSYPDQLEILPLTKVPHASVRVPGSKSITNRALVLAALADAPDGCLLEGALRSEDTEVMVEALRRLGYHIEAAWDRCEINVWSDPVPPPDRIPVRQAELFVGNSGTSMRFLAALVALGRGRYRLDGVARMRERPIEDLLGALRQLGIDARSEQDNQCPPVVIESAGMQGGDVRLRADLSSQFLSALLMAAAFARGPVQIYVDGVMVSEPYVAMTVQMMQWWGLPVERPLPNVYRLPGGKNVELTRYQVEPDASAASYFFAAAAITGGCVSVPGLPLQSLQGDVRFVDVLEEMGSRVERHDGTIRVTGDRLFGTDIDMNDISDTVMTLAAVACFAEGPTTIRNVAHIRHKETDRLTALATELRKVGAEVVESNDGLTITPRPLHGAVIDTYNDHRMAMSMALIGLKVPGVVINNPGCVAKTYPGFWTDLEKLRS